jgi:hypothetical protein
VPATVSIARSLFANIDFVRMFEAGMDRPPGPCTYCHRCVFSVPRIVGLLGRVRFDSRYQTVREILSVFEPA